MQQPSGGAVRSAPRALLRLEGLAVFGGSVLAYAWGGHSWWWFGGLFLVPDISMMAYLVNVRIGAAVYNLLHTLTCAALLAGAGLLLGNGFLLAIAIIWSAHIGFDRMLGYGLKYATSFGDTHLGYLGAAAGGV